MFLMKYQGIVVKIKDSHCIVLSKDGTYHKLSLSGRRNARVGAEIEFARVNWLSYMKPALMAASLLIAVLGFSLFRNAAVTPTYAYVSLDINPSMELEVDSSLRVLSAHSLNADAEKLLSGLDVKGAELYTCVATIMSKAAQEGYIKPGQKNYVLSTVTMNNKPPGAINYNDLAQNMKTSVENKDLNVEIVIMAANLTIRNEAKEKGLSTGKMAVYKDAVGVGEKVTLEQVKKNSVSQLVNEYNVKLLPNDKNLIIKTEVLPREGRRYSDGDRDEDENDLVDAAGTKNTRSHNNGDDAREDSGRNNDSHGSNNSSITGDPNKQPDLENNRDKDDENRDTSKIHQGAGNKQNSQNKNTGDTDDRDKPPGSNLSNNQDDEKDRNTERSKQREQEANQEKTQQQDQEKDQETTEDKSRQNPQENYSDRDQEEHSDNSRISPPSEDTHTDRNNSGSSESENNKESDSSRNSDHSEESGD